ncbi:MAG: sigma-70 family RNA polymerase sigma factor [Leeuwenhoekiella sp.]
MTKSDQEIISRIKKSDSRAVEELYLEHNVPFLKFASRYDVQADDLEDIYQDAVIVVYEKAVQGNLDELKSTIRTYLFSVGKYMIFELSRKKARMPTTSEDYILDRSDETLATEIRNPEEPTEKQHLLMAKFKKLGTKCQEILKLFYYEGHTITDIMQIQGYDNLNVVKSQKSRCLKTLKKMVTAL